MPDTVDAALATDARRAGALADLFPGYFALVMATGIIAIGALQQGLRWLAWPFLWGNVGFYVVLWLLFVVRLIRYPDRIAADLTSHHRGPPFLTMVAGTNVLAAGLFLIGGWRTPAFALFVLGTTLWVVLFYAVLTAVTVKDPKPDLPHGIGGGWLILVVGTESVAVVGALLAAGSSRPDVLLFMALGACMAGLLLYLIVISLVCYRWWFYRMGAEEATPPYWINMGALAITTLACANIYSARGAAPAIAALGPFLAGMTALFWAGATWWIPLLISIGIWRHVVRRVPIRYDPQYWSLVFPLGMYAAATFRLSSALGLSFLDWVPKAFLAAALVAWVATFVGMVRWIARSFTTRA